MTPTQTTGQKIMGKVKCWPGIRHVRWFFLAWGFERWWQYAAPKVRTVAIAPRSLMPHRMFMLPWACFRTGNSA